MVESSRAGLKKANPRSPSAIAIKFPPSAPILAEAGKFKDLKTPLPVDWLKTKVAVETSSKTKSDFFKVVRFGR